MARLEFAEITALVPFSTPTPVCDSYLHPSARMAPFFASVRPDPDAIDKSDHIPAQLTARYWHHADSNA